MEKILLIAVLVTAFYCLAKFIEIRFIEKETKPLKFLVRDAAIVFVSGAVAAFICFNMDSKLLDFMNVMTDTKTAPVGGAAEIFTDAPGF
jgi:hypothetical protein